jgi:two-component system alkaline phosphatase synthesis response regulator PhoP
MIYCVEDDENIRDLVVYTLNSTGLEAEGIEDGKAFWHAMERTKPELILLDIMLPGEDGISILKKLRADQKTAAIPVIMLTAKGAEYDKVMALDLGADDYVTKPFGMMELVSRIKAVLRRTVNAAGDAADSLLSLGMITMDTKKHEVRIGGSPTVLTLKEYELLKKLMMNSEVVLTRDQLLEDIWGYDFDGETRTVDVHIRTLRQKLGRAGDMIETVRGVGYRIR